MKKGILIVIILGMFGWAVYSFINQQNDEAKHNESVPVQGEKDTDKIGLEKGDIAPDFSLKTLNGEEVKLSDYRGKRVMINFWASWCGPCRAEMPDIQRFHETKDIVILAVNLTSSENSRTNVTNFVKEYEMTFPILMDETEFVAGLYAIKPIPTTYLINSDGTIHNKAFGALNYEQMAQEFEKMK